MECPICLENAYIQPPLNRKECDHKGICQKCKEAWKNTCFDKNERATCPYCRKIYAIPHAELSRLTEIVDLLKEAIRLLEKSKY